VQRLAPDAVEVDAGLLETEALVDQRSGLFAETTAGRAELGLSGAQRRRVAAHPWLLFDDPRQRWWAAVQADARRVRRRWSLIGAAVALLAAGVAGLLWRADQASRVEQALERLAQADAEDGEAVLEAVAVVLALRPDDARLATTVDTKPRWAALDAAPERDVEAARIWLFDRLLPVAENPMQFGHLAAGTELARHPETPGRWSEVAYDVARIRLHLRLVQAFGAPPEVAWRTLPKGTFIMGSAMDSGEPKDEKPPHPVTLTRDLAVMRHEVTRDLFRRFHGPTVLEADKAGGAPTQQAAAQWLFEAKGGLIPMWGIRWHEAQAFAAWLHPLGRLPTEAEWEAFARGGKPTRWWTGDDADAFGAAAWLSTNTRLPKPVCEKEPGGNHPEEHPLDLCDTAGNLYEWTADVFEPGQGYPVEPGGARTDPVGPRRGVLRALRGGSFLYDAANARSAVRSGFAPTSRLPSFGFRVVRPAPGP